MADDTDRDLSEDDWLLTEAWGAAVEARALVQALIERLVPLIAEAEGRGPGQVLTELRARADELHDAASSLEQLPDGRRPLERWGPDPMPGAESG